MKILHTSDWHLGRSLYGKKRYEEFEAFLNWLEMTIESEKIDALLIAGDIFDTTTPGNRAQELYYRFLCNATSSCCRNIVIIAGNHDSPSFLDAPEKILSVLNVYVIGSMRKNIKDEVIVLNDEQRIPQAIVCAVPYLRDKDIRKFEPGESSEDKNARLIKGLRNHYADVFSVAEKLKKNFEKNFKKNAQLTDEINCSTAKTNTSNNTRNCSKYIPVIGMGHLFTAGGKTIDGDGVRELYVGSLAHVDKDVFPASLDYMALGHLHVPQRAGEADHIRYSGSPIPMGFGESDQKKKVITIEFNGSKPIINEISVPCFQPLEHISGAFNEISEKIEYLKKKKSSAWLEIEYTGVEIIENLRQLLDALIKDSSMEIRCIKNKRIIDRVMGKINEHETLDDLDVNDVFQRCLDTFEVSDKDRLLMKQAYMEIIQELREKDKNAE